MKKLDFLPNLKNKYSIRKFTVGTASILIGSLLFLGHNDDAQAAEDTNENAVAEVSNDTTETQSSAQENEKVTPETTTQIKTENVENTLENNKTVTEQQNVSTENKDAAEVPVQSDVVKEQSTESESVQKNNEKTQDNKISVEPKKEVEAEKSTESSNSTENTVEKVIDKASVVKKDEVDNSVEREVEDTSNKTFNTSTEVTKPEATKTTVTESEKAPKLVEEKSLSSENLSTEQKVEKVKAELSAQRDSAEIDQALSVIDTEGLTSEEIKAEVVKLLFKRGLAEKELYTPQATPPRKYEESPKYAVRAGFKVNTDLKDGVVVTKDNFNDYFWTVDNTSYDPDTGIATLTPNEPSKKGAITLDTKLNVNKDFHFSGEVNLGDKYEGHPKDGAYGGDGISFTFNPGKTHDLGLYGSAIGVGGLPYAFGFKLDTYVNNSPKATEKAGPDPRAFNNKGAFGSFVWADASGRVTTQDGTGNWKAALLNVQPEDNKF